MHNLDDVAELAAGTWLFISSFLLSYTENRQTTLNAVMIHAFLPFNTMFSIAKPAHRKEYLSIALTLFLIASPYLLGFCSLLAATINRVDQAPARRHRRGLPTAQNGPESESDREAGWRDVTINRRIA